MKREEQEQHGPCLCPRCCKKRGEKFDPDRYLEENFDKTVEAVRKTKPESFVIMGKVASDDNTDRVIGSVSGDAKAKTAFMITLWLEIEKELMDHGCTREEVRDILLGKLAEIRADAEGPMRMMAKMLDFQSRLGDLKDKLMGVPCGNDILGRDRKDKIL